MPARAPGERPKEGETVQEHDLEDRRERRDRQASEQGQQVSTKRKTWVDLIPDDQPFPDTLFTREEIADMASGIDRVTAADIQFWERQGILPRSIRRRHEGATRVVYPEWFAWLARIVRRLQRYGLSLDEIRPRIWNHADMIVNRRGSVQLFDPPLSLVQEINRFARGLADEVGSPVAGIEITVELENGDGRIYGIPVTDPDLQ